MARAVGVAGDTVRRGRAELQEPQTLSYPRSREPGGGRKRAEADQASEHLARGQPVVSVAVPVDAKPIAQLIANVDFAQTILECAGVQCHPRMQGASFWPQLTTEPQKQTRPAVYYRYFENDDQHHHALAHYGTRTDRYKLIYFYNDGLGLPGSSGHTYPPEWELYDMETDPAELVNVYHDPAYRALREELKVVMWNLQPDLEDVPHDSQPVPERLRVQ